MVAAREIGSAYGALKKNVADKGNFVFLVVQDHMSGRMSGAMINIKDDVADGDLVTIMEPAAGGKALGIAEPVFLTLSGKFADQKEILFVGSLNGDAVALGQGGGAACVIHVPVRDDYFLECYAVILDRLFDTVKIAAWVDGRAFHGFSAP